MKAGLRSLILILLAATAWTQAAPPAQTKDNFTPRKLLAIHVTGTQHFKPDDVAAASGLAIGKTAGEDEFRRAAERLGDSGAFDEVTYNYTYTDAGVTLMVQAKDAQNFVPARFEDFVGFTDDELIARIKQREPLFDGTVPASGKLAAQISDVLQGLLIEKKIPGRVEYDRLVPSEGGKVQAVLFSIEGALILIRDAKVTGAGPGELPRMQAVADRLKDHEYRRSGLNEVIDKQLMYVLREKGYLKGEVKLAPPKIVSAPENSKDDRPSTYVDLEFVVQQGKQYRVSGLEWMGNKAIPTQKLEPLLHTKVGEVANTIQLSTDLESANHLYGSQGYIRASVKAKATFDDAASTVKFALVVIENEQFKMGELEIRGTDRSQEEKLRAAWRLRPGDIYDADYLHAYLPEAVKLLPRTLDWTTTHHLTANVRDNSVDVEIDFTAQATK